MSLKKKALDRKILNIITYICVGIFALFCIIPFLMVVASSLTSEAYINLHGYSIFPMQFSFEGYHAAFLNPMRILRTYAVTIFVTVIGTAVGVFLMSMTGYVLQRRDFKWANKISFFIFFTTLFNGGLVPWYIICYKYLHMENKISSLIIPYLFSVFFIIILKSFMRGIPESLAESAKIDGANDFLIFIRIILPIAKPAVAAITLFTALSYWNDWFMAMIFIKDQNKWNLQYFLYTMITQQEALRNMVLAGGTVNVGYILPTESLKMAMTVIATGPILLLYPVIQKYFIKGLTVGAVKG